MNKEEIEQLMMTTASKFKKDFWLTVGAVIFSLTVMKLCTTPASQMEPEVVMWIQQFYYIYSLGMLWFSMRYFSKKIHLLAEKELAMEDKVSEYLRFLYLRLGGVLSVIVLCVPVNHLSQGVTDLYIALMAGCLLFFCYTSAKKMAQDLKHER